MCADLKAKGDTHALKVDFESNSLQTFVGELRLHMLNKKAKYGVKGLRRRDTFWNNVLLTMRSSANGRKIGMQRKLVPKQFLPRKRNVMLQRLRLSPRPMQSE